MTAVRTDWPSTRALVTGGSGFLGHHLVDRLATLGAEVHVTSRSPRFHVAHHCHWHVLDLADADAVTALFRAVRPDVVFHLSSAVTGSRDAHLVVPVLKANLLSTVALLSAAADQPGTRVVLAGSMEEPRLEDTVGSPSSPYAAAKWAASGYAAMFHHQWGVPVTTLRVAMAYGPGQHDRTKLLPYVITELIKGNEVHIANGNRLLDWVYVDDVTEAFIAAAETTGAAGTAVDIGSGVPTSIRDTVEAVRVLIGAANTIKYGALPARKQDSARIATLHDAARLLQWRPRVALEDGLRRTAAWYAEHG